MNQQPREQQESRWSRPKLIAFRFAFVITVLSIPVVIAYVPGFLIGEKLQQAVGAVLGRYELLEFRFIVSLSALIIRTATGDSSSIQDLLTKYQATRALFSLVYVGGLLIIGTLVTIIWTGIDRRRTHYITLNRYMRVYLRYAVALIMSSYALDKVIPNQFGFLAPGELLIPFGQLSRRDLLWNFMAVSPGYVVFTGLVEMLGAVLVFFRRTTLAGALVLGGALTNVVAMDIAYKVPAVRYAILLLIFDVIILAPYLRPLMEILVLGRRSELPLEPEPLRQRWYHSAAAKGALLGVLLVPFLFGEITWRRTWLGAGHPVWGLFDVTTFVRNGQPIVPLASDKETWKRVASNGRCGGSCLSVQFANGDLRMFQLADDLVHHTWTIRGFESAAPGQGQDSAGDATLQYAVQPNGDVSLDGKIGSDSVHMLLHPIDASKFFRLLGG